MMETSIKISFLRRLAAMAYDSLLLFAVLFFAGFLALPLTHGQNNPWYSMYLFFISYFYFAFSWKKGGSTVGMLAWKIRLQTLDRQPVQWTHTLLRFMVAVVPMFFWGLGFYGWQSHYPWPAAVSVLAGLVIFSWPLWDKNHEGWQDKYSETELVIRKKQ
jgi:uncharacterized RDD family membrane protein YckC